MIKAALAEARMDDPAAGRPPAHHTGAERPRNHSDRMGPRQRDRT